MGRIIHIFLWIVLGTVSVAAQNLDSLARQQLGGKIDAYFGALAGEDVALQKAEADFMIELSADSLIRQFTAVRIYEYYVNSPVMGAESVAVHVFDRWFSGGQVRMNSDIDFLNAKVFADFNRQSLIGERAPDLTLWAIDGSEVCVFPDNGGRFSVLYFYDTDCRKCKLESILLRNMLITEDFPVDFYAVYAGDSRESWEEYVSLNFDIPESVARICHLWDPTLDSDFQRKYGVLRTPRMFLVGPDGTIIGRGLDTKALTVMLHALFDEKELEYGSDESVRLFDGIFSSGTDDVVGVADYIENITLGRRDTVTFRQLTGDLLYYLSNRREDPFMEGADYLIDSKILSRPDVWRSQDDSLKVVGMALFMDSLLEKARPGTKVPDFKVSAERLKSGRTVTGDFRLSKAKGRRNIIIFYTEGCAVCDSEKAAARRNASEDRRLQVFFVNVDRIMSSDPDLAARLFESFDLSSLPFILETDRKGIILRRYITLSE